MARRVAPDLWRIGLCVPEAASAAFAAALEGFAAVSEYESNEPGAWVVEAIAVAEPDRGIVAARIALVAASQGLAAPEFRVEKLPPTDWLAKNQKAFPPIAAGRYFIHGRQSRRHPPAGAIGLRIDAGLAFGTGEHASTRGCLLNLEEIALNRRPRRILDLGCGTGILAMAAARTWPAAAIVAADIDRDAVAVTRENAGVNALRRIRVVRADGLHSPALLAGGRFDLIFANILARPLCRLARGLGRRLAGNGLIVLAGLLSAQEREVLAAYRRQGLTLRRRRNLDGWQALVLGRNRHQRRQA